jgi:hypothetical protein
LSALIFREIIPHQRQKGRRTEKKMLQQSRANRGDRAITEKSAVQ